MNENSIGSQPSASRPNDKRSPEATERGHFCPPERRAANSLPQPAQAGQRRPRAARVEAQAPGSAMFTKLAWEHIARSLDLSGRELQIVRGIFDDATELAIARNLGISPHTVHTHFDRLHRKLGVTTRTGLVLRITRQFLAPAVSPQNPLLLPLFAQQSPAPASARTR